jgi:hypothetical protein
MILRDIPQFFQANSATVPLLGHESFLENAF